MRVYRKGLCLSFILTLPRLKPNKRQKERRKPRMTAITLIDNYDSFTWNLVHCLGALGADVTVLRNAVSERIAVSAGNFQNQPAVVTAAIFVHRKHVDRMSAGVERGRQ